MGYRKPKIKIIIPERVAERAATRYRGAVNGCWISTYSVASHGYAQIGWHDPGYRQIVVAHRAAWVHYNGQIPEGMTIDHLCRTRPCVNPAHLRMMTNFENARRTFGMDWDEGQCINGHSNKHLVDDFARKTRKGKRRVGKRCKLCVQLYQDRKSWTWHNGDKPYPHHLMLSREKIVVENRAGEAAQKAQEHGFPVIDIERTA